MSAVQRNVLTKLALLVVFVFGTLRPGVAQSPDFSLTVSPTTISPVTSGTATVTVSSLNGFNSPVTFSASNLPSGVSATFSAPSVTPLPGGSVSATVTIAVAQGVSGSFTVTITGTASSVGLSHSAALDLELFPQPGIQLLVSPTALTLPLGTSGVATVFTGSLSGFTNPTGLSISGLPSGVTASFSPQIVTPSDTSSSASTLTISVSSFATAGSFSPVITGTSGTVSSSVSLSLTVPNAAPSYAGFVDNLGCGSITGWAADRNRLNTPINVSLYDGNTLLLTVAANISRPDVAAMLGDNGYHGFSITTPASLQDGNPHSVHLKFESSNVELTNSPQSLTCSAGPPPKYVGYVDSLGCSAIVGWAADRNRLNTSITVSVYDGETLLTSMVASNSRPDVGAFLGDNGLHGYSIATPPVLIDGQNHMVHVKFEGSSVELTNSPQSLTCGGN